MPTEQQVSSQCEGAVLEALEQRVLLSGVPMISEFMASNDTTLVDGDGKSSDWIELHNPSAVEVDLAGWFLTDDIADLIQWEFPDDPGIDTTLDPGEYRIIFASAEDDVYPYVDPAGYLHTNFKLSTNDGSQHESVLLVRDDTTTIEHGYIDYPQQYTDVSYGVVWDSTAVTTLASGAAAKVVVPDATYSGVGTAWTSLTGYDDSSWSDGTAGIGFDITPAPSFDPLIAYDIEGAMEGVNTSAYVRIPFTYASSTDDLLRLALEMQYDDGFVAYLNGVKVAESNAPGSPEYDSSATDDRLDDSALEFESFTIDNASTILQTGANMLAIHGMSASIGDGDFLAVPSLVAVTGDIVTPEELSYFAAGTPFEANVSEAGSDPDKRIIINELHVNPDVKTEPVEFIELYNNTDELIDLSGWYFSNGVTFTFAPGTVIGPYGYLVIAENVAAVTSKFAIAGVLGPYVGSLDNDGEKVTLRDSLGAKQDEVDYGLGFPWPTTGDAPGYSLELISPELDNDLGGSWRASLGSAGSQGVFFETFEEWKYFKGVAEPTATVGQWHEGEGFDDSLWLTGDGALGYSNMVGETQYINTTLDDMDGGYSTVYFRKEFNVANPGVVASLELQTRADDGIVVWINDTLMFSVNVDDSDPAYPDLPYDATASAAIDGVNLIPHTLPDPSTFLVAGTNVIAVQLLNASIGSSSDAFWDARLVSGSGADAGATAGMLNSVYSSNAAPQMRQVAHGPNQPVSGQDVTVTVKATDPEGVAQVTMDYQVVNPGDYISISDSRYGNASFWTTVDMYDDGTNGDAVAGDDVYSAIIPAAVQTNRKLVRYRVTAVDTLGASVTGPYDDDPQQNFAYYVYDGVPDWTGSARPGVESDVVYSSQTLTSVPVYTLITRRLDRLNALHVPYRSGEADQELPTSGTYGGSDYKWEGTLIYDGVVYDNIRYRARGGVWRYSMGKNMWKFDFNRGHSFQARDDYGNLYDTTWDKLNFSAIIQQGNFGQRGEQGLFEAAGFALHNLAGNESPNTNFIHFRVVEDADESGPDQFSSDFQGLYLVLEQPDGRMLDEHDMPDGNFYKMEGGTGTLNNQGPTQPTDKSDLNTFMGGYQSSPTQAWFEANLDLDNYYNFRAMAMATHDYDIHAGKNYFYYHNPETDLWSVQNWDLDLTWTTSYGGGGGRGPLNDYVFAHPQFVIDYNNRLRELRDLLFNVEQTGMLLDEFAQFVYTAGQPSLVDADAAMWDYNPIMVSSYVNSSKSGWGRFYGNSPTDDFAGMIQIMKDYVAGKTNNVDPRVSSDDGQAPNTPGVWYTGPAGYPIDSLTFQTTGFSGGSGGFAAMEWRIAAVTDTSSPGFDPSQPRKYEITPSWESGEITSYSSSIAIPGYDLKAGETYRVRVRMKDSAGRWSHWSAPAQLVAGDADPYILDHLRITELNYSPHEPTPDEITAGHVNAYDFEFIELQNTGSEMMDLSGISFVDGITFDFAGSAVTSLTAGERVVIVRNEAAFAYRYSAGLNVAGSYQGFLSNGGELVMATDAYSRAVVNFTFNDAGGWSGRADGKGATLEIIDTAGDYNDSENWRASVLYGGTPDAAGEPPVGVVINEVLSHTDVPDVDSIELYNTTGGTIDIGGWFISDSWGWSWSPATGDYKKYQIAPNTLIGSGQYLVFDESDFNSSGGVDPLDFALSAGHGDDVWLMKTDGAGNLTHFADHVDFGAAANGESFGRWPNAVGDLYPMTLVTLDGVNSGPRVGPLIISEVMYNAPDPDGLGGVDPDDLEFIELYNPTGSVINLAAWEDNIHTAGQYYADWRFRGGVSMSFDAGSTVAAGGILVVLSFDPNKPENASRVAAFRDHYGIDVSVPLAGGYSGKLNDDGERIELQRPDSPSLLEPDFVPHLLEDQVRYDDVAPWAVSPDGLGDSLQRTPVTGWGDDSANWIAATPDPGAYAVINNAPVVVNPITDVTVDEDASDTVVDLSTTFDDPDLGDTLTLSVSGNTNVGMVTTSVLGANLTLSYIADQNGTADITIRATDPLGAWVEDTFAVTVNPINDAPPTVVSPISDVTVDEDASDTVIDLESVFDDIDVGDTLVYSITSNTNISLVTTNIVGSDLTLSYAADQNGSSEITVRATDQNGAGSWVEDTFTVTVDPVNDAPTLASPLAEVTVDEDAPDTVIDLSSVFDDIDLGDALTFQVTVNTNISLVATDVTGSDLTLSYLADQSGSADITVRATDSGAPGLFVEDTFSVTVDPVNDAPTVIAPISDVNAFENDPGEILNLAGVFYDAEDGANVTLSLEGNTNPALVTANLVGSDLTVSYAADQSGSSDITIRATDTAAPGLWVEETFTVTVNPDNFAPTVVSQIADLTVNTGDPDTVMYLSDVFDDSVGLKPTLDYTVIEIDPVTGVQSAGTGLFLYTFTLYGNDGVESVFATTTLTFTGAIQQTKAFGTADVNDELNAAIFEGIAGSGYIAGLDTWVFAGWQEIAPNDTSLTGSPVVLSVGSGTAEYFEQKDVVQIVAAGDVQWTGMHSRQGADYPTSGTADANRLAYSVSNNTNPGLVTASVVGAQLTLDYSPGGSGLADITIRATDPDGAWVEDTFTVTVESSSEVVGRHVFYNNSSWDAGGDDNQAVAPDKTPLLPGGSVTAANYTSYSRGINGIMVDIAGMTGTPKAGDFIIKVNASDDPDTWSAGPAPTVSVHPGEGFGGSDRVKLIWPDGAIANQWVEVTVRATGKTGLGAADVFYYGNAVGEINGDGVIGQAEYDSFKSQFGQRGGVGTLASDFDGDGRVGLRDFTLMRSRFGDEVQSPTVPAPAPPAATAPAPALAPEADLLAESSTTSEATALDPLSVAVGEVDLSTPTASPAPEPSVELELTDVLLGEDSGEGTDASLDTDSLLVDVLAESLAV